MDYILKHQEALMDIAQFMFLDLKHFLEDEGRFKFRMIKYYNSLTLLSNSMNKSVSEDDIDFYGRILFLYRKTIISEYKFLRERKITPADASICIIHRLCELISESNKEFRFNSELNELMNVINLIWNNIKHPAKNKKLTRLTQLFAKCSEEELVGKLSLDEFSLYKVEHQVKKEQVLYKETKFLNLTNSSISEVQL